MILNCLNKSLFSSSLVTESMKIYNFLGTNTQEFIEICRTCHGNKRYKSIYFFIPNKTTFFSLCYACIIHRQVIVLSEIRQAQYLMSTSNDNQLVLKWVC